MTPYQALDAATAAPALYLGQDAEWGTITVGKAGNVLLLDGNPLENISNTRKISGVLLHGIWYSRESLDRTAAELARAYRRTIESSPLLSPLRPGRQR